MEYRKFNVLSIDAWREPEGGWFWNQWYTLEKGVVFSEDALTTRSILTALRKWGYLTPGSKGKLAVEDDGYNLVVLLRNSGQPLLALEPVEENV